MELVPSVAFVCSRPSPRFLHSNCCVGVVQTVKVTESHPKNRDPPKLDAWSPTAPPFPTAEGNKNSSFIISVLQEDHRQEAKRI